MARPEIEISARDRLVVKVLAGFMSQEEICSALGYSRPTLRKHFKEELKQGKKYVYSQAIGALFSNIRKGKEASIFFYLKTQHGWKENHKEPDDKEQTINLVFSQRPDVAKR